MCVQGWGHRVRQALHTSVCTGAEIATVSELRADLWPELWQPGALALCLMIKASLICYPAVSVSNPTRRDGDKKVYSEDIVI